MSLNLSSAAVVIGALRVNENAVGPDQLASDESIHSRSTLISTLIENAEFTTGML